MTDKSKKKAELKEGSFDMRPAEVLGNALKDGLFIARNITPLSDSVAVDETPEEALCSAFLTSELGSTGIINIMWQKEAGTNPLSIFAYAGQECTLKEGVTYEQLCARCFEVNQETPLANVTFRIDEPNRFLEERKGYIVALSGLPLLPFETDLNYRDGGASLETLFVGAMESAFAADAMTLAYFQDFVE